MLTGLLQPKWSEDLTVFLEALLAWEKAIEDYQAVSGKPLPDEVKTAILARKAPALVRRFLQFVPIDYLTYAEMKLAIQ
eukprot:3903302-Heterocapsa_arctica.AAC.1